MSGSIEVLGATHTLIIMQARNPHWTFGFELARRDVASAASRMAWPLQADVAVLTFGCKPFGSADRSTGSTD